MQIKGILSFPALVSPKIAKGASEAKYSCTILIPAADPQVAQLLAAVETAKADAFPSGYTGTDECFSAYDSKYAGKEYYDPRFSGWYVFSCSAKADDKPALVDSNLQPVMDPAMIYPGAEVWVHANISGYTKGRGGIGGWLNGVMFTGAECAMGRLDNKPTAEQMFAGVGVAMPTVTPTPPVAPLAPPPAPSQLVPTAAAGGASYAALIAAGWTDETLLAHGMAAPSF